MSNKRYYWLKLNETFFEDDTIQWLEEQENGKDYVMFYLKLMLKSLRDDGSLIRYVGERLIPYDVPSLAKLTGTNKDTVAVAMKSFVDIGLVETKDSGEIYMNQIEEMVGSETESARKVRRHRARKALEQEKESEKLQCNSDVIKCNAEKEIEREIEIDIEKEQEQREFKNISDDVVVDEPKKNALTFYEHAGFGMLSPYVIEELEHWINDLNDELVTEALKITAENAKSPNLNYAKAIMKSWVDQQVKSLDDVKALNKQHTKSNEKEVPEEYANLF